MSDDNKQVNKRTGKSTGIKKEATPAPVKKEQPIPVPAFTAKQIKTINKMHRKKGWGLHNIKRISTTPEQGLTFEQANERFKEGYANITVNKNKKTYLGIILSNLLTFFNLLSFLVAGALIAVGAADNVFFLAIVVANILIGIIQEVRAKNTMDKISLITAPSAKVVRSGKLHDLPTNQLTADDIIEFTLGDQISADCKVISGSIEVNESLLTGESNSIKKTAGDMLLGGSFVTGGNCVARVENISSACYAAGLAEKAKRYTRPNSELLGSLKLIIKLIAVIIIPIGIAMWFSNSDALTASADAVKRTAGAIMGMIPAGMFLLSSMALFVGVIKLYKKRTLVQDLYSIEMLSRVDVLCLDKTGTLTDGTMKVSKVIKLDTITDRELKSVMSSMLNILQNNNQTSQSLVDYFGQGGSLPYSRVIPFSSERKFSAVEFKNKGTFVYGAPEFILSEKHSALEKLIKENGQKGYRVLLLAHSKNGLDNEKLPKNLKPIAMIMIQDTIRKDAESTIKWFTDNSVAIRIISGDNPITVSEVARRVGVPDSDKYISLSGLSDQDVIKAAANYTVFGRVSPEQKAVLVRALKAQGHKVAMTGDGVNDILALKEADCSIAMASGSEATRSVSHLVLLDSNFSSMPSVVAEGRRVINNVSKSSSLFLMKTMFIIMLAVFSLAMGLVFPFIPNQLLLLEFFAIGVPSFFLALQPNNEPIRGHFLFNIFSKAMPAALIFIFNFLACYIFNTYVTDGMQYETMASLAVLFSGLIVLFTLCRPINPFRGTLFFAMLFGAILALLVIPGDFFDYVILSRENLLFTIALVETGFLYVAFKKPYKPSSFKNQKPKISTQSLTETGSTSASGTGQVKLQQAQPEQAETSAQMQVELKT